MLFPSKLQIALIFYYISRIQGIDVRLKGDKCSNLDSCRVRKEPFRTCSCADDCYKYGTCCIDAEHFPLMSVHPQEYHCYDDRVVTPVFAKRTCLEKSKFNDHTICTMDTENDKVDVLNNLLVTSSKTKITYWNKNCGVCNNEELDDLTPWTVQVVCPNKHRSKPLHQKVIRRNLTYSWDEEEWGLNIDGEFVNCSIVQYQPADSVGKLKYCAPAMVEACPPNHHGDTDEVSKYCSTYHGERKLKDANVYFKNVHCALCNGASLKDLDCIGRNYSPLRRTITPNTIKVVFSADDWNAVMGSDQRYRCSKNFGYDPFTAKCRKTNMGDSVGTAPDKRVGNFVNVFTLFIFSIIFYKLQF